jgi:hypothetical protein
VEEVVDRLRGRGVEARRLFEVGEARLGGVPGRAEGEKEGDGFEHWWNQARRRGATLLTLNERAPGLDIEDREVRLTEESIDRLTTLR